MQSQVVDVYEARVMMDIPVCVWMTTCNLPCASRRCRRSCLLRPTNTNTRAGMESERDHVISHALAGDGDCRSVLVGHIARSTTVENILVRSASLSV
jgi:hypothetical protein